jgi:hypothetical protein
MELKHCNSDRKFNRNRTRIDPKVLAHISSLIVAYLNIMLKATGHEHRAVYHPSAFRLRRVRWEVFESVSWWLIQPN